MTDANPRILRVEARTEVRVTEQDVTPPQGDGDATVIRVRGKGPMTSTDPRFVGTFEADAVIIVDNEGEGVSRDDWRVVDDETGETKVRGTAHGIHNDPNPIRAVTIGRFADGDHFFGNARVTLPEPGTDDPIVIEYGGPGLSDPENRAVAVSGECEPILKPATPD